MINTKKYWILFFFICFVQIGPIWAKQVLLFPYFDSNGENGVYLCWSFDGSQYHQVNEGKPIFVPPQWKDQNLTRDPSIVFHEGKFHMVWTSNWNGPYFGYASSTNLKDWSQPKQIQPFPLEKEQPKNVWAPEIFWDHIAGNFKIVWSSTLPSELNDGDGSEDTHGYDHRMYYIETKDFQEFSLPKLIFADLGYSVIDAQIVYDIDETKQRWIMVLKKEVAPSAGGKNIRLAFSPPRIAPQSFQSPTQPFVGAGTQIQEKQLAEGPALIYWNDEWLLYWDSYKDRHYSKASSRDLENWQDETDHLEFPVAHPRHGTPFIAKVEDVAWSLEETKKP